MNKPHQVKPLLNVFQTILLLIVLVLLAIAFYMLQSNAATKTHESQSTKGITHTDWKFQYVSLDGKTFTYHKGDSVKHIVLTSDSTANVIQYKTEYHLVTYK